MDISLSLFTGGSISHTVFIFSLIMALGLCLASVKVWGIELGTTWILFVGLAFGNLHLLLKPEVLSFARELGLILFVYTIGLQAGPSFFTHIKRNGFSLNILAMAAVLISVTLTVLFIFWMKIPVPLAAGLFAGATTNTPALGAAEETLKMAGTAGGHLNMPALGYAVSYPFGAIGLIILMIIMRFKPSSGTKGVCVGIKEPVRRAETEFNGFSWSSSNRISKLNPGHAQPHYQKSIAATAELDEHMNMVQVEDWVEQYQKSQPARKEKILMRRIFVMNNHIVGKTIAQLDARRRWGVWIMALNRAEFELPVTADMELHFGDTLVVIGEREGLKQFALEVGHRLKKLNHSFIAPIFFGVALGIWAGNVPWYLPWMKEPIRLGSTAGALIVALLLGRIGRVGRWICHMPLNANFMLRELGVGLFLASVGLYAGEKFFDTFCKIEGLKLIGISALITVLPVIPVAMWARKKYGLDYLTLCGFLAGTMTNTPALSYANSIEKDSTAPAIAYAMVYPTVTLLRVIAAQFLILLLR